MHVTDHALEEIWLEFSLEEDVDCTVIQITFWFLD